MGEMRLKNNEELKYLNGVRKLSSTERTFMELIWEHPEGISSEEIYRDERFQQSQGTKSTILFKINEKGYVRSIQQGRHHIYYPLFTRQEYEQAVTKQQLEKSFGSPSFSSLVASFCGKSSLSEKQIERVNQLLEDIKNESNSE